MTVLKSLCSHGHKLQFEDVQQAFETGGTVFLLPPEGWALLKQRLTFGHWEVRKGKCSSREVAQAADGSVRVGQPAHIKNMDFVPLGKLRKEQHGDATEVERHAMRSVLGALGYLARESRPDLSVPVSFWGALMGTA